MNPSTEMSFKGFLSQPKNRKSIQAALGISIGLLIVFKLLYPYPDFFSDSYSYIFAASANLDISIWPIGYSKFLRVFHTITNSDTALVATQYLLFQLAATYLFLTINYLYKIRPITRRILFLFIFVNPLSLYLSNTINSDALFGALSIAWFAQLLWITQRPNVWLIFTQSLLLIACFTIRNNAYYYPFVATAAFLLTKKKIWYKLSGISLPFLFLVPFIIWTRNIAFKVTGTHQFSLFTGWQLANNALYIYDQIDVDSTKLATQEARELNRIAVNFFKHVKPDVYREYIESYVGNFFIRQPEAPLKQYFTSHYAPIADERELITAWGKASASFEPFGKYIILHFPISYIWYFMRPNVLHYFLPPLSHLEKYNYGKNEIDTIAKIWFHYPSLQVRCISHKLQSGLIVYTALFLLFNLYFLWQIISFTLKPQLDRRKCICSSSFAIVVIFIFCNFAFSIFSTVNILRYQFTSMILLLCFGLIISDYLEEIVSLKNHREESLLPLKIDVQI